MDKFILASQSPRRRELLKKAGYQFEIYPPKLSETLDKNLSLDDALVDIARQKSDACFSQYGTQFASDIIILASDTMVIFKGDALGKPQDRSEAKVVISSLSGQPHEVKTSILLKNFHTNTEVSKVVTTRVTFKVLTEQEIEAYLETGEWSDKAGSYGIQGAASAFVARVEGSLENVIGLPTEVLPEMFSEMNL